MSVMTIGFRPGTSGDVERRSLEEDGRLPEASTIVILLDVPSPGTHFSLRQIDFTQAIKRGARIVFVSGPQWRKGFAGISAWLAERFRFTLASVSSLEIQSHVPALQRWFDDQRAHAWIQLATPPEQYKDLQVIASGVAEDGQTVPVSLRYRHGRTEVVFLPLYGITPGSEDVVLTFLDQLAGATEYPAYLDALDLGGEKALRDEFKAIEERRSEIEETLAAARRTKQILYFAELELEREVVRFLADELGIPARHVAGSAEDFRLLDEGGDDWAIGEVKGYETKNVPRGDLGLVDIHRGEADFADDAPALLVGNTFHTRTTLEERDERIPDNVIRRAAEDHILVVRTLDLIRLKLLALDGRPRTDDFVEAIRQRGGWFEVNAELRVHVHPK